MTVLSSTIDQRKPEKTFIDALLAEEREWTAVDQFSNWHDSRNPVPQNKSYRRLIPFAQPKPGQQYAFEVDLERCSGCKACVAACHSLNGLDDSETWRSVGLLVGAPAVQQHVTTACHHCVDPGCLNGCPVLAYDKDPLTGIVRHLDDQCIGCQYCVMKCPYEVPQYSKRLGIVRKCDMCHQRLRVGEAPACAQACPTEAIRVTIVNQAAVSARFRVGASASGRRVPLSDEPSEAPSLRGYAGRSIPMLLPRAHEFLPDSPDPALTLPTTRYLSGRASVADLSAADHSALRLEKPHWPLIVMLLLSQAAAGLFLAACFLRPRHAGFFPAIANGTVFLAVGLVAATLHLGRPLKAWRAFLGWRTSWLSRELLALNAFAATTLAVAWFRSTPVLCQLLTFSSAVLGLVAVFASAMVYIDTSRPAWNPRITFPNFFGATLLLGATLSAVLLAYTNQPGLAGLFSSAALGIRSTLFIWRRVERRSSLRDLHSPLHVNARILRELLPWTLRADVGLFIVTTLATVFGLANQGELLSMWITVAALATFGAETIARYVYFVASASKRMPGGVLA